MKLKLKLTLAVSFLFVMILVLGGIGTYYLRWLAKDSHAIIEDNYRTLGYMEKLDQGIDRLLYFQIRDSLSMQHPKVSAVVDAFRKNIQLQLQNVTEPGEQLLSEQLLSDFETLTKQVANQTVSPDALFRLLEQIDQIYALNQEAILRKNTRANNTAHKVVLYMSVIGLTSIIVGLIFAIRIPGYISRPIVKFNKAIKKIAKGDYDTQLNIQSNNEFGQLATSFNRMAAKLNEYEHSNLAKLLGEKKLITTIINEVSEAVIGLDEGKHIIFANDRIMKLLGMPMEELAHRYAPDVAVNNKVMNSMICELMVGFEPWEKKKYASVKVIDGKQERFFSKKIVDVLTQPVGEDREILIGHVIILSERTDVEFPR